MKTARILMVFSILMMNVSSAFSQTYDIYIANRRLLSSRYMEFDVYIRNNGNTAPWALRLYQSGYRFGAAFVNNGTLTGAYVSGSSELESSFGKTWGFSYNSLYRVLNQSSNTGSSCPGALIGNHPRRIGTFRVSNSVNWGCADDSICFVTGSSGVLNLSVGKYNSTDCSDPYNSLITAGAHPFTAGPGTALQAVVGQQSRCDSMIVTVSAVGGLSPYAGTGTWACGPGEKTFSIQDARRCTASITDSIRLTAIQTVFFDTACDSYYLPWDHDPVYASGQYRFTYPSAGGCDSDVVAHITIRAGTHSICFDTVCSGALPYWWNGIRCDSAGVYSSLFSNAAGCDSTATLFLSVADKVDDFNPGPVKSDALHDSVCLGSSVRLSVSGILPAGASWCWYEGGCGSGNMIGTDSSIEVRPGATTSYYVQARGGICGISSCDSIRIAVMHRPVTSGIGEGRFNGLCNAKDVLFKANPSEESTGWHWYVPGGVAIREGQGTASIRADFSTSLLPAPGASPTNICISAFNRCGSGSLACRPISLSPGLIPAISGPSEMLRGQVANFRCDSVFGASNYYWQVPAGWKIQKGQGSRSVLIKAGNSSGVIQVAAANACGRGPGVSKNISLLSGRPIPGEVDNKPVFFIHPNPAAGGNIYLEVQDFRPAVIEIFDAGGRIVLQKPWANVLDISKLVSGLYCVKLIGGRICLQARLWVVQ